jgi:HPt (histidine-containing phosphotransfer) domain-containing protein
LSSPLLPEELPGFDFPDAMARVDHNHELMILLLQRFVKEYESTFSRVIAFIDTHQAENATFLLHKFQGACLMIGANELSHCARQLELEIESGDAQESLKTFAAILSNTCQTIKNIN